MIWWPNSLIPPWSGGTTIRFNRDTINTYLGEPLELPPPEDPTKPALLGMAKMRETMCGTMPGSKEIYFYLVNATIGGGPMRQPLPISVT